MAADGSSRLSRALRMGVCAASLALSLSACVSTGSSQGQGLAGQASGVPASSADALAGTGGFGGGAPAGPPSLDAMVNLTASNAASAVPDVRAQMLRDTAMAYGAQGGLARRGFEINEQLSARSHELSRVYNFNALTVTGPGNVQIMPPVISEAERAMAVADDGQSASQASRVYEIVQAAHIASTVPEWRTYLIRGWAAPVQPVTAMLPRDDAERAIWRAGVADGWDAGYRQADTILASDLDRLQRDYEGMIRYRTLVAQGMVTELFVSQADLGVTSNGTGLKIGDKVVRITGPAGFNGDAGGWDPILEIPLAGQAPVQPR